MVVAVERTYWRATAAMSLGAVASGSANNLRRTISNDSRLLAGRQ